MAALTDIKSKAASAFDRIGKTNGTSQPHTDDNQFALIYEYFISDMLASIAGKRKEAAKEACLQHGLLSNEGVAGTTVVEYDNELLTVSKQTKRPSETLDKTVLQNELVKALGAAKAQEIIRKATKTNKAAVSYLFAVK